MSFVMSFRTSCLQGMVLRVHHTGCGGAVRKSTLRVQACELRAAIVPLPELKVRARVPQCELELTALPTCSFM